MYRDDKIDGVKAVLIFLMVLGHMAYSDYRIRTGHMIYAFHMPAFVFISGYLTTLTPNFKKHIKWVLMTLAIYIGAQWYQSLYAMLMQLRHGNFELPRWTVLCGLSPCFSLWYILSLVYWRVGLWTARGHLSDRSLFVISIFAAIVSGYFPLGNQLSFQRTLVFMPMFVLGYLFKKHHLSPSVGRIPICVCVGALIAGLCISRYLPFFLPSSPYARIVHDALVRSGQCGLATVLIFSFFRLIYALPIERIARWGKYTLWVYIGHSVPITIQNALVAKYCPNFNILWAFFVSIMYIISFTLLAERFHSSFVKNKSNRQ